MKEKVSALIDGELQSDSLHAHLGRLRADPELRGAWDTYHLIGDALRGQISPGIADRVVARLREEPTVLAPRPERDPTRRLGWYAMSAAASVAAVAFVAWTASPGWRAESQLAGGPDAATVATPGRSGLQRRARRNRELPARASALFPHERHARNRTLRAQRG